MNFFLDLSIWYKDVVANSRIVGMKFDQIK